jgi:hypothetical protein
MKWLTVVGTVMVLLALVLAVPALASPPTEVSGEYTLTSPPLNRTWWPAGSNCIVEVDFTAAYTGDLVGTTNTHYRIVSHGPCGPNGPVPGQYHETLKGRGTFTGNVVGVSGTFDYTYQAKVWPADPGELNLNGRIVILKGSGGLVNLHGILDVSGIAASTTPDLYTGWIHFDPKP